MVDDSRYRQKVYLDTYLSAAAITKDDAATSASYITAFSDPQYPLKNVLFSPKNVDAIFSIEPFDTEPLIGWDKKAYAYHEQVPITIYTADKTGITALKLENKCAQELRRIFETYPTGSVRYVKRIKHGVKDMGGWNLYHATYLADYTRVQENYTPTYPTITMDSFFVYDGDRIAGSVEGTWSLTKGGSTIDDLSVANSIQNSDILHLHITAFVGDAYVKNGTALAMSSTSYTTIRWRYRTSGSATAKIVIDFSDASTQTVLAETASADWTVGSATITAAKTINYISLYCCDGAGYVDYDFVQICSGTYIFPNVVEMEQSFTVEDAIIPIPGRSGDLTQIMGNKLLEVTMTCDLNHEPWTGSASDTKISWKRPQTNGTKTDYNNIDFFVKLCMDEGALYTQGSHQWEWLDLGYPTIQGKFRLVEVNPSYKASENMIRLKFREFRLGGAQGYESYLHRYSLNL